VEMFSGSLGKPAGGWPKRLEKIILRGSRPRLSRPKPVDFAGTAAMLEKKLARKPARDEVLSYLMYPQVFLKFAEARQAYSEVEVLPTPQFFYGMQEGEEITVDIEPGKTLIIKFLTAGEPHPDGYRTLFFELNGQSRAVNVRDRSLQVTAPARPKADRNVPGQVGAPMPGLVTTIAVELNQPVKKGDRLLVMEAMKMQSTVYAPRSGRVAQKFVQPGQHVEAKDLLVVIEEG